MGDLERVEDLLASSLSSDKLKKMNSEEGNGNVTPTKKQKIQDNGAPLIETQEDTKILADGEKDGSTTEESKIQEDLQQSEDPEKPQQEPHEEPQKDALEEPQKQAQMDNLKEPQEEPQNDNLEEPQKQPQMDTLEEPQEEPQMDTLEEPQKQPQMDTLEEPQEEPQMDTLEEPQEEPQMDTLEEPQEEPQMDTLEEPQKDTLEEPQMDTLEEPQKNTQEEPQEAPQEEQVEVLGPDDVICDSCIDRPCRAKKSCLTCLVSYCESHLRPHLENVKFQSHKLVEPLRDIERLTCESHLCPLERFCCVDTCCVCQECVADEHRGHNSIPITEARRNIERELRDKQTDVLKTIIAAENAINKLQLNTVTIEASVKEVQGVIEGQFNVLLSAVEQAKRDVNDILEVEQRQALKQAEGIRAHMEQRCTELKKTQSQIEKITKNKSAIAFLQEYSEWKKESSDVSLPGVYIGLMDRLQTFSRVVKESTKDICEKLPTLYPNKLKEKENVGIKTTVYAIRSTKKNMSIPNPKTREDFLKYSTPLNLDADTAHRFLRMTEEKKKVSNTTPWQHDYPDLPERFEHFRQVLTVESFYMGRHYFEVDLGGEGAHVGLTYKSIDRKGSETNSCITGNNFSWCLQWNGRSFSAWHSDVETPLSVPKATRIGVYVDYSKGVLGFYDVESSMALIHQYQAEFLEPLYPAFWLPKKENVVLLVEPEGGLNIKTPSPVTSP